MPIVSAAAFVFQVFPDVTILFSDVVKFNEICIHITPMQVVDMLNEIYIVFDTLSEKHNVYKVRSPTKRHSSLSSAPFSPLAFLIINRSMSSVTNIFIQYVVPQTAITLCCHTH